MLLKVSWSNVRVAVSRSAFLSRVAWSSRGVTPTYIYMYIYMYTYTYVFTICMRAHIGITYHTCCIYVWKHGQISSYTYVRMYASTHVRMYVGMQVGRHVCMCVCMFVCFCCM